MEQLINELLPVVKSHLQITWSDEETDKRVGLYIAAGIAYLNDKYGGEADYTVAGYPRTLLLEYCRYFRDAALDVYEQNYLSLILAMQHQKEVKDYAEANAVSAQE
jgi:hypothetical protein